MFLSKSGKYYYVYYQNPNTGKRTKRSTKCKLKKDAYQFLRNFSEKLAPKPKNYSFREFRAEMLKYANYHYSPKTYDIYSRSLHQFEIQFGNILMNFIKQINIEKFKEIRINSGISKTSVNIDLRALKAMFNMAVQWGFINSNPCAGVKEFTIPQKEILAFRESEVELILKAVPEGFLKNIVQFALYTGCRLREITNVQWRDIELSYRIIHICNKPDFKTKNGKIRTIPISSKLLELLEQLRDSQQEINPEEYLFHSRPGVIYDGCIISRKFRELIRSLNFPRRYHFHCLRHTFITQLARKGVNIYDIKQLAGHSDISTTELYMHNITEDLRRAVELL